MKFFKFTLVISIFVWLLKTSTKIWNFPLKNHTHRKYQLNWISKRIKSKETRSAKHSISCFYVFIKFRFFHFDDNLMRAHRTQCRCLKRCGLCIIIVGILPIIIIYLFISDQIYYKIKHKNVSKIFCFHLNLWMNICKFPVKFCQRAKSNKKKSWKTLSNFFFYIFHAEMCSSVERILCVFQR